MAITITHGISGKKYSFEMKGTEKVVNTLNKMISKYKDITLKGVSRAALLIRRESLVLTPEDTGNLKESCFVAWTGGTIGAGKSPNFVTGGERGATAKEVAILYKEHSNALDAIQALYENKNQVLASVCYSAYYALFVHEIKPKNKYKVGQWKFLETAINQNRVEIMKIIAETVKSKGGGFTGESKSF